MSNDARAVWVAYAVAASVAVLVGLRVESEHAIWLTLWADVAATLAIFAFSALYRNSSLYDPYWSVAPIAIAAFWCTLAAPQVAHSRQALVFALVVLWGVRLTWNWTRNWEGLHHEDWRYRMIAEKTGVLYWPASLIGIHMLPTLQVFAGCLPLWPALAVGGAPLSGLDALAFAVTAGSIGIEALADQQLRAWRRQPHTREEFLDRGLWRWCRHPNYLGEIGFWWGLYLFGLAADPGWAWTGIGALAITLLFLFASLPMLEGRMRERRPGFAAWAERSSLLLPWPPRSR